MKTFPIMRPTGKKWEQLACPRSVPWRMLQENQALANHDQTLERLAERGGLDPLEAILVIEGRPLSRENMKIGVKDAINRLLRLVNEDAVFQAVQAVKETFLRTLYLLEYYWHADDALGNWVVVGVYAEEEDARKAHRKHEQAKLEAFWSSLEGEALEGAKAMFEMKLWDDVRTRPMFRDADVDVAHVFEG